MEASASRQPEDNFSVIVRQRHNRVWHAGKAAGASRVQQYWLLLYCDEYIVCCTYSSTCCCCAAQNRIILRDLFMASLGLDVFAVIFCERRACDCDQFDMKLLSSVICVAEVALR